MAPYLDAWLAFRARHHDVPGVQAAVRLGSEQVLSTAHGVADVVTGAPLTTAHLFRIASHSKTFTATAIMQLVEDDRLSLDDRIGRWLPFLPSATGEVGRITVAELLAHGGGILRDGHDGDFWQLLRPFPDADELLALLRTDVQVLPPNERFKYSNIGYGILGLVIEAITGERYHRVVTERIIDRLDLHDTAAEYEPARAADYASGHTSRVFGDRRVIDHVDTRALASATGFVSTASDLCAYASAHCFGDDRLLGDESKRRLQRVQWDVGPVDGSYGLGFRVAEVGTRTMVGHGGGYPGHITATLVDPVERLAVSVLTNAIDGPASELVLGLVKLLDAGGRSPHRADQDQRFVGRFANLWSVLDVVDLGDRLVGIAPTLPDPLLSPITFEVVDDDTLRVIAGSGYGALGERWRYERDDDGRVSSIRAGGGMTMWPYSTADTMGDLAASAARGAELGTGSPW